ncbi:MAG: hypothetical protein M5U26_22315 [Planctomycetota bacterium]|nr:hypothetical protein [Planctomycetota bacterium]
MRLKRHGQQADLVVGRRARLVLQVAARDDVHVPHQHVDGAGHGAGQAEGERDAGADEDQPEERDLGHQAVDLADHLFLGEDQVGGRVELVAGALDRRAEEERLLAVVTPLPDHHVGVGAAFDRDLLLVLVGRHREGLGAARDQEPPDRILHGRTGGGEDRDVEDARVALDDLLQLGQVLLALGRALVGLFRRPRGVVAELVVALVDAAPEGAQGQDLLVARAEHVLAEPFLEDADHDEPEERGDEEDQERDEEAELDGQGEPAAVQAPDLGSRLARRGAAGAAGLHGAAAAGGGRTPAAGAARGGFGARDLVEVFGRQDLGGLFADDLDDLGLFVHLGGQLGLDRFGAVGVEVLGDREGFGGRFARGRASARGGTPGGSLGPARRTSRTTSNGQRLHPALHAKHRAARNVPICACQPA